MKISTLRNSNISLLIFSWAIITLININKAYHMDDTFHLEAANCIEESPLTPLSGKINWENSPMPMYEFNQPPLFFYTILLTKKIFNDSEIVMHLMMSIFSFLSIFFFYRLTVFYKAKNKKLLLLLFAFCPAFIVNQNLMTDVPILAMSLGTMYFLLMGLKDDKLKHFIFSVIFLSLGLLIKYSLIPLFFTVLLSIVLSKKYKNLMVLIIPILVISVWSLWNIIEYDSIHILDRPKSGFHPQKILAYLSTLGSVSFISGIYIYYYLPKKITQYSIYLLFVVFCLLIPLVYYGYIGESISTMVLSVFFLVNGLTIMSITLLVILQKIRKGGVSYLKSYEFPIMIYIIVFSLFIGLLAPFNATRHILLITPFLILAGSHMFDKVYSVYRLVLFSTIIIGVLLGISDWIYADFYRRSVINIKIKADTVWSMGHWGWQWYSKKAGMRIYSTNDSLKLNCGDYIVFPKNIHRQELSSGIRIDTVGYITEDPSLLTFLSGKNYASMYISSIYNPPWSLSNITIDTIFVCKVTQEIKK